MIAAYVLIAPSAIGLGVFMVWPAIQTFGFSFTHWGMFGGHTWTGLDNYTEVLTDSTFYGSLLNTLGLAAFALLAIPISIVLAVLLNTPGLRGLTVFRVIYFLPVVTLPAAIALVWKYLYNGDYGLVNMGLRVFGIDGPSWISDPRTALMAIGLVMVWSSLGYNIILFLAGLQSIPTELYEAAEIDGAGRVRTFFSITVPMLTPTIFFVLVITTISALQIFDLIYLMMSKSNPALDSVRTVLYLFYEKGFIQSNGGYAAAVAFVLLIVIGVLTLLQFGLQKRWVNYD